MPWLGFPLYLGIVLNTLQSASIPGTLGSKARDHIPFLCGQLRHELARILNVSALSKPPHGTTVVNPSGTSSEGAEPSLEAIWSYFEGEKMSSYSFHEFKTLLELGIVDTLGHFIVQSHSLATNSNGVWDRQLVTSIALIIVSFPS